MQLVSNPWQFDVSNKMHSNAVHDERNERKPLSCNICQKRYSSERSLNIHIKTVHENQAQNSTENLKKICEICEVEFSSIEAKMMLYFLLI